LHWITIIITIILILIAQSVKDKLVQVARSTGQTANSTCDFTLNPVASYEYYIRYASGWNAGL